MASAAEHRGIIAATATMAIRNTTARNVRASADLT